MKKVIALFICVFFYNIIFGQTNEDLADSRFTSHDIFPSLSSFKISRFGNIPINHFTGAANYKLLLTSLKNATVDFPIYLSYNSNGIMVDEMNGDVGLGWTLIKSGIISRTVRGKPDEEDQSHKINFVPNMEVVGNGSLMAKFLSSINPDIYTGDFEPDIYTANFNNYHIEFFFDRRGAAIMLNQKDFIIERQGSGFLITVDNGTKYYFNESEEILRQSSSLPHNWVRTTHAWFLTKIEYPGNITLIFKYTDAKYETMLAESQVLIYSPPGHQYSYFAGTNNGAIVSTTILPHIKPLQYYQKVRGKQLSIITITTAEGQPEEKIIFTYGEKNKNDVKEIMKIAHLKGTTIVNDINFSYLYTANDRLFLQSVEDSITGSKYSFNYINPNNLPPRLAPSRDKWGYYNARSNNDNYIPQLFDQTDPNVVHYNGADQEVNEEAGLAGLLKNISYPTGGKSDISYERHKKYVEQLIAGSYGEENFILQNDTMPKAIEKEVVFTPSGDGKVKIEIDNEKNDSGSCSGVTLGPRNMAELWVTDKNNNPVDITNSSSPGHSQFDLGHEIFYADAAKGETLKVRVKISRKCQSIRASIRYKITQDTIKAIEVPVAGYRVSQMADSASQAYPILKKFIYKDRNGENSINVSEPIFQTHEKVRLYEILLNGAGAFGGYVFLDTDYYTIRSNNLESLTAAQPAAFYSSVQEQLPGQGSIVHTFDTEGAVHGYPLAGEFFQEAPTINVGWNFGNEIETEFIDTSGKTIKKIEYNYSEDLERRLRIDFVSFKKNYTQVDGLYKYEPCTQDNVHTAYTFPFCANQFHRHHFNASNICTAAGSINRRSEIYGVCYGQPIGSSAKYPYFINSDIVFYSIFSHFGYLKSTRIINYLNNKEVASEQTSYYNNELNHQKNKNSFFGEGFVYENLYEYAHEKSNQYLIDRNMVGIPLRTTVTKSDNGTTKTISDTELLYPASQPDADHRTGGLAVPYALVSHDLKSGDAVTEATYDRYDKNGNLQQYTVKSGLPTAVVWGYGGTQPIAKVEGARYTDIDVALINSIVQASDADNSDPDQEPALITALDRFRRDPRLSGYQITTYTYDPLVGVTSITPPSGVREYYHYDAANRLDGVTDLDGNILKEYRYNYKH